jgi:hypothetical protein
MAVADMQNLRHTGENIAQKMQDVLIQNGKTFIPVGIAITIVATLKYPRESESLPPQQMCLYC